MQQKETERRQKEEKDKLEKNHHSSSFTFLREVIGKSPISIYM